MSKRTFWRFFATLAICAGLGYFFLPISKIHLGLDLRGGVHYELEVQGHEALEADLRDNKDRIQDKLREKGLPGAQLTLDGDGIKVDGVPLEQKAQVEKVVSSLIGGYSVDAVNGGLRLSQTSGRKKELIDGAGQRALQIIENRINQFGVAEPEITRAGADGTRIVVELPGVEEGERERIKTLLSTPGRLEQRMVANPPDHQYIFATKDEALQHYNGNIPAEYELFPNVEADRKASKAQAVKAGEAPIKNWILMESRQGLDGADIIDAHAEPSQSGGGYEVGFVMNKKGGDIFADLTGMAADQQRSMGIILDRRVVEILGADQRIVGGIASISNHRQPFTAQEAEDMALTLRSGAMKASMRFLEERVVGPSLGRDSIRDGVFASLIGFGTIILFMVFWYRWSGVNAIVALTVNIIVMLGLLGSFHATITLPGIAGFALTVGMAVDANILIFERIREELAQGKSVASAIQSGFDNVFWTIVDAHVTQLFAALLLFSFGTGPVKGFAVALAVGVSASLFTSIYVSRFIYDWILERHPGAKTLSV